MPTLTEDRAAVRDLLARYVGSLPAGTVQHMTTDAAYDVDGDIAMGVASFMVVAKGAFVTVGRYHDDLVRVAGAWRIRRRVAVGDATA